MPNIVEMERRIIRLEGRRGGPNETAALKKEIAGLKEDLVAALKRIDELEKPEQLIAEPKPAAEPEPAEDDELED